MRLIRIYIINKNLYYYYYYLLKQQRTKNLEPREWNRIIKIVLMPWSIFTSVDFSTTT